MTTRKSPLCFIALSCLVLASAPIAAQSSAQRCTIEIKDPLARQEVAKEMTVKGTVTLPSSGHHIWIFVRPIENRTDDKWYPQAEGFVIDPETNEWEGPAWFAPQNAAGGYFDVTAAVFSQVHHAALAQYREKGQFAAIQMPSAVCAVKPLTVRKVQSQEPRNSN